MPHKSEFIKSAIIQKALSRKDKPLQQIALENNVGYSTLQRWLQGVNKSKNTSNAAVFGRKLTQEQKIQVLLETANLDELSVGAYCRERGLYRYHLEEWKKSLMTENPSQKQQQQEQAQLIKKLQAETKQLKKELRRKDKALAETSALLILKKKADLIWGDLEED